MNNGIIVAGVILLALLLMGEQVSADVASQTSVVDLGGLAANFAVTPDQENRINALYSAMQPYGLSSMQQDFMLAQLLHESGLLTSQANYNLMDNYNNYAGLTSTGGSYASYPSLDAFMQAYIGFLSKGSNPLGATSLTDFNNRLVQNHYYTDDPTSYYNDLAVYYNLLSQ